jgi:hypothetical protein
MDSNDRLTEQPGATPKQIPAGDIEAISGGATECPTSAEIDTSAVTIGAQTPELAAAIVNVYEDIVQSTSSLIERVLGPYNSEP